MRVIFLDFDGVLNSVGSFIYNNRLELLGLTETPTHKSFCPVSCSNLEYILEECPDVQVVVSSTWRRNKTLEALKEILKVHHIMADRMIGTTPICASRYRGDGIKEYNLLMYVEDSSPKIKKFVSMKDMEKFVSDFEKKYPDPDGPRDGNWIDYCVTDVSGKITFFTDGISLE